FSSDQATTKAPRPPDTSSVSSRKCVAPGSGYRLASSALSAAIIASASGEEMSSWRTSGFMTPDDSKAPPFLDALSPLWNHGRIMTTILSVRRDGGVAMAGDGQVTLDRVVMKEGSRKVRTLRDGSVLVGFAGGAADALSLFTRFEAKLDEYH